MTDTLAGPVPEGQTGGGESTLTVIIAFVANFGIALAKTVVALLTGSASMLAESAHSWADTGNEIFLLVADGRLRDYAGRGGRDAAAGLWLCFGGYLRDFRTRLLAGGAVSYAAGRGV